MKHTAMDARSVEEVIAIVQSDSKILVEASPQDRIWGIGMGKNNSNVENPTEWRGHNLLGFALMEVRERLFAEA